MAINLRITSRQRVALGDDALKAFDGDGGTIGRSLDNDWILPDPERYISGHHCSIDFQGGAYYLVDTSTNGVYVNDSSTPVGKGHPQRLFDGDRMRMGDYEITIAIEEAEQVPGDNRKAARGDPMVDPVERAKRVPPADPTGITLVDANEITGAVDLEYHLKDDAELSAVHKTSSGASSRVQLAVARQQDLDKEEEYNAALRSLLHAAGIDPASIPPDQAERVINETGQLLRELVVGLIEVLQARAELKNMFRLVNTTTQPSNNNPLKFAAGVDEALKNLLDRPGNEYVPPVEAVREAFQDVKSHQLAVMAGIGAAFQDFMERFDPEELQQKFDRGLKRSSLFGATNKMKYWDLYSEFYQVMAHHSENQLPHLFGEEFSRVYEATIERHNSAKAHKKTG